MGVEPAAEDARQRKREDRHGGRVGSPLSAVGPLMIDVRLASLARCEEISQREWPTPSCPRLRVLMTGKWGP